MEVLPGAFGRNDARCLCLDAGVAAGDGARLSDLVRSGSGTRRLAVSLALSSERRGGGREAVTTHNRGQRCKVGRTLG
jgi:hypothetical protein